jgi:hypothetical protein
MPILCETVYLSIFKKQLDRLKISWYSILIKVQDFIRCISASENPPYLCFMAEILFTQPDWQLFLNLNTLPQQAGVAKHLLPKLVAKELTDNALDTGAAVEVRHESPELFKDVIIVRDFGKGIRGADTHIADLLSVKRPLTSSKRLRLPLRGALGNGLRVVVATVYGLGGELLLSTQGRTLRIAPQDDGTSLVENIGEWNEEGTEIRVTIPDNFFGEGLLEWAEKALQIRQGEIYTGKTNPFWYDSDSFYGLLLTTPVDISAEVFLHLFAGINDNKVRKFLKENRLPPTLAEASRAQADVILGFLRSNTKEIPAKRLGAVGELVGFQAYQTEFDSFEIKTSKGEYNARIPAVIEVFAKVGEAKSTFFVNKTPITGEVDISYYEKRVSVYGCGLAQTHEIGKIAGNPVFWVNVITPYMPIVSNGKEPDLSILAESIGRAIKKTAAQLKKQEERPAHLNLNLQSDNTPSQKQVVLENLEKSIALVSGNGQYRYSLRQLYYVARPLVMEQTGRELKYPHFNQIITDYEHELGQDLTGVYRDERGTLLYPHTHEEIKLGTKSIERYRRPVFHFNKILYSEKEGFFEILKEAGFCEKHDCALLTSKGFASRAARDVIDLLAETEEELQFFCIHDADLSGTLIYQALQGATKARPGRKVRIINLGLEPWEGLTMGLEVESLEKRSAKNAAQYVADFDTELGQTKPFQFEKYQRWADWQEWLRSFRIELNAMDTPTFVTWLDRKITPYNTGKVIPPENYLQAEAHENLQNLLKAQIQSAILEELNIEKLIIERLNQVFPAYQSLLNKTDLENLITQTLTENTQQSWRESFGEILRKLLASKQK